MIQISAWCLSGAQRLVLINCYSTTVLPLPARSSKLPPGRAEMHRAVNKKIGIALAGIACGAWYLHEPTPTLIVLRIGQPFAEVVRNSSYPIMTESVVPSDQDDGFGATYVTEPSVVLQFNDPKHGFTLPPTTFLAITYMNGVVATVATSPMLKKLPFDQTVELLARLQDRFSPVDGRSTTVPIGSIYPPMVEGNCTIICAIRTAAGQRKHGLSCRRNTTSFSVSNAPRVATAVGDWTVILSTSESVTTPVKAVSWRRLRLVPCG